MKFVQKLGKALMLPVACLPICGILMGLGYAMCPSTMQGGDVTGVVAKCTDDTGDDTDKWVFDFAECDKCC